MGNQIDACNKLVRADESRAAPIQSGSPSSPQKSPTASPRSERQGPPRARISRKSITEPGNAQRAKDAVYLRDFVEKVEKQCATLAEVSEVFGAERTDLRRFEHVLRERFGYTDSAVIERVYVCTDFLDDGAVSHFELAHLFSAIALTRNLWKQLKGRSSHAFVIFCKIGDNGAISKPAFQKYLMDELRYHNADLADYLFSLLDLDGDGDISWEEFEKFWAEVKPDKTNRKSHKGMSAYWLRESADQLQASNRSSPRSPKASDRSAPRLPKRTTVGAMSPSASPRSPGLRRRMQTAPTCLEPRGCNSLSLPTAMSQTAMLSPEN